MLLKEGPHLGIRPALGTSRHLSTSVARAERRRNAEEAVRLYAGAAERLQRRVAESRALDPDCTRRRSGLSGLLRAGVIEADGFGRFERTPMPPITPMNAAGVRHLVERAYRESGELQYLRELLVNGIEAGATRIEFGPEWRAVERENVYRLMVADDGVGMSPEHLLKFLNTFGGGGKPIGDAHENYGVGAKTSLLPWNHLGVVVLSWTAANPDGAMIRLMRDPVTGEYGAEKFETADGGFEETVVPHAGWLDVKPDWIRDHGTVIVCLGNTGREHTFVGKDGKGDQKAIAAYLNKRMWEVPAGVEVFVQELRSTSPSTWPRSLEEAMAPTVPGQVDRRWNRRQLRGAHHYVTRDADENADEQLQRGTVVLEDGTAIDWYLAGGERSKVDSYAHAKGFMAALYRNELYDTRTHAAHYRSFGITQAEVRGALTLIARPPMSDGRYGVYPDTARNALKIQGTKRAGEPLPWAEWAQEFAERMPPEIVAALAKATPTRTGSLADQSWRDRLAARFGARWSTLRYVKQRSGSERIDPTGGASRARDDARKPGERANGGAAGAARSQRAAGDTSAEQPEPSGPQSARAANRRGGVPDYEWTDAANIDQTGRYAAAWSPPSASHPGGLVQLATDFPAFVELRKYWRDQYPDHLGDQIDDTIAQVYGEGMVARIAHSEALVSQPSWGRETVERELRSPTALTMAVLGLLTEDQIIASKLAGMGVRRRAG